MMQYSSLYTREAELASVIPQLTWFSIGSTLHTCDPSWGLYCVLEHSHHPMAACQPRGSWDLHSGVLQTALSRGRGPQVRIPLHRERPHLSIGRALGARNLAPGPKLTSELLLTEGEELPKILPSKLSCWLDLQLSLCINEFQVCNKTQATIQHNNSL